MITGIHGSGINPSNGAEDSTYVSSVGSFGHKMARECPTVSPTLDSRSSADLSEKPKLKDRLVYPFKVIRNRIYTAALTGGSAGIFLSMGVGVGTGAVTGFALGMIPQILQMVTFSFESYALAYACAGLEAGARIGAFFGLGIGAVTALASVAISLALSVVHLPRDIYHAATMDKPRLDAPLPEEPWLAQQLNELLSELKAKDSGR